MMHIPDGTGSVNSPTGAERRRLITGRDLVDIASLPALTVASILLPERRWPWFCGLVGAANARLRRGHMNAIVDSARRVVGDREAATPFARLAPALGAGACLARLYELRARTLSGWRPEIEFQGGEEIAKARERGRGAVLWISNFVHGSIVTKMAFHGGGYSVTHLGGEHHASSGSRFGMRFIAPARLSVEGRYLRERVVWRVRDQVAVLRHLRARLSENELVSFTVTPHGRGAITAPFLSGRIRLATGAPGLARMAEAPLLPVFTVRLKDGRFRTVVRPPLLVPSDEPPVAAAAAAAREYAAILETFVLAYPDQWHQWRNVDLQAERDEKKET